MLLYKKNFDKKKKKKSMFSFWIFTLTMVNSECTGWDVGRACISGEKKKYIVSRRDVTGFLPKKEETATV